MSIYNKLWIIVRLQTGDYPLQIAVNICTAGHDATLMYMSLLLWKLTEPPHLCDQWKPQSSPSNQSVQSTCLLLVNEWTYYLHSLVVGAQPKLNQSRGLASMQLYAMYGMTADVDTSCMLPHWETRYILHDITYHVISRFPVLYFFNFLCL